MFFSKEALAPGALQYLDVALAYSWRLVVLFCTCICGRMGGRSVFAAFLLPHGGALHFLAGTNLQNSGSHVETIAQLPHSLPERHRGAWQENKVNAERFDCQELTKYSHRLPAGFPNYEVY